MTFPTPQDEARRRDLSGRVRHRCGVRAQVDVALPVRSSLSQVLLRREPFYLRQSRRRPPGPYPHALQAAAYLKEPSVILPLVDQATTNVLSVQFRLGVFDKSSPFDSLGPSDVDTASHRQLSPSTAARHCVVLLKKRRLRPPSPGRLARLGRRGPHCTSTPRRRLPAGKLLRARRRTPFRHWRDSGPLKL